MWAIERMRQPSWRRADNIGFAVVVVSVVTANGITLTHCLWPHSAVGTLLGSPRTPILLVVVSVALLFAMRLYRLLSLHGVPNPEEGERKDEQQIEFRTSRGE